MKKNIFKLLIYVPTIFVLLANPAIGQEDREQNWFQRQVRQFRAYPHLDRANRLIESNRLAQAKDELEKYLAQDSNDIQARMQYVDVLNRLKEYALVIPQADIVLKAKPQLATALAYRGLAYQHLNQEEEALADFRAMIKTPNLNAHDRLFALNMIADLAIKKEHYADALTVLEDISSIAKDYNLYFRKGVVLQKLVRLLESQLAFQKALDLAKSSEERLKALLSLGELYKENKDWMKAQQFFDSALEIEPDDPEIMLTLGELAYARKDYPRTIQLITKVLAVKPSVGARELLGNAYFVSGDSDSAIKEFTQLLPEIKSGEDRYRILMARGYAYSNVKQYQKAAEDFEKAMTIQGKLEALLAYAQALADEGDNAKAIEVLKTAMATYPSTEIHIKLGALYAKVDDYAEATRHLEEAAKGDLTTELKVSIYKQQGFLYYKQGLFSQARAVMEQALDLNPQDETIYASLGETCIKLEAFADAEQYFKKSLELNVTTQGLRQLAEVQMKQKKWEAVTETYQRLLADNTLAPEIRGEILESQGHIFSQMGKYAQAATAFRQAIDEGRDNADIRQGSGFSYYQAKDWQAALEQFQAAKNLNDAPVFSIYMSRCYRKLNNLKLAMEQLEEAKQHMDVLTKAEQADLYRELGYLYLDQQQYDLALKNWQELLEREYDPEIIFYLGNTQRLAGDLVGAQKTLEKIKEENLSPESRSVWFDELADIYGKQGKTYEAYTALSKANLLTSSPERLYQLGLYSKQLGLFDQAITYLEAAVSADPQNATYAKDLGYAYLKAGRLEDAIRNFETALVREPPSLEVYKELGYLQMRNRNNDEAVKWFKLAVDNRDQYAYSTKEEKEKLDEDMERIRGEIHKINNRFDVTIYDVYRPNSDDDVTSAGNAGGGIVRSQGGVEFAYQPHGIGFRDERILQFITRVSWNNEHESLRMEEDSFQGAVGFRYKPFKRNNLYVGAERLFAIGDQSIDDWLLRAMYSWGDGLGLKPGKRSWNYTSVYGDVGYFLDTSTRAYYAQFRQGRTFNFKDTLLVTPHLTVDGRWEDPDPEDTSYSEAGGGLLFNHLFNESHYEGKLSNWEWLVQYKNRLEKSSSGVVVTSVAHF